ncbi:hypothetical protein [Bifidobacterium sp. SO4]|uniref:hypothetical protein n=1 Tax=Bifidobacterium sp. SO4 TaxID=2809030 RepID=UPI001F0A34DD|nr:hypothetical protein [Bifidobacterium sp. SO4]
MNCQYCHATVNDDWTLCASCRADYARQLHQLRRNLYLLQRMANREYRLTEQTGGGKSPVPPTPADLGLLDEIDQAESLLKDIWTTATGDWRVGARWQRLIPRMQAHMGDLSQSPMAGEHLTMLIALSQRFAGLVDRRPRTRRLVGVCPDCGRDVLAGKGELLWRCRCGRVVNIPLLREETRERVEGVHLTRTPAGLAEWLRENYGYRVSRKQVTDWLRRGKLPSSKPVEDGYWEFNVREVLTLAMGANNA